MINKNNDAYKTISEVAELLNSIKILKKIKFLLKVKGMTVKGVKKHLLNDESDLDETIHTTINTKNILKSKLSKISKIIKELKK